MFEIQPIFTDSFDDQNLSQFGHEIQTETVILYSLEPLWQVNEDSKSNEGPFPCMIVDKVPR